MVMPVHFAQVAADPAPSVVCGRNQRKGVTTMGLGNGLRLTWVGHATWIMETPGGKRVLIDPWVTGNPVVPDELKDPGPFDVLLLTHGHNDHTGDAVDLATRHSPKAVLAMIELGDYLESKGVENVIGYNKGGTAEAEGLRFTMVDARHSSSFTQPDGTILHTGDPNGYIVTLEDGRRVYVAGDTSVFGDMALIGRLYKPDVAILPIGDFFTMGPFEAAEAIRMLGVKKVVPTHYGTFPALHGTPDQLRREAADVSGLEVLDVAPGGTVE
jgi:L-ascorbate metabolism protein UlaG (beta-lactamase superfamily)